VRGTGRVFFLAAVAARFIPAGAGNSQRPSRTASKVAVHPRGCGEQTLSCVLGRTAAGSSPRVRGTASFCTPKKEAHRFIPAGAGNRRSSSPRNGQMPVHPRGCGEQIAYRAAEKPTRGSSPRVRGTDDNMARAADMGRFIPAGAGNSPVSQIACSAFAVHPRGCGEQKLERAERVNAAGSSPRVRGTVTPAPPALAAWRFIPAGAGNRCRRSCRLYPGAVHPRGCGEQTTITRQCRRRGGSSPRVRGTAAQCHDRWPVGRFIPAGAGNSDGPAEIREQMAVHPRGCGEQERGRHDQRDRRGSSPRVRGTAPQVRASATVHRFIPAGAGNRKPKDGQHSGGAVHPRGCGEQR